MLGFASKTMGSKPCASKPQPNLDDYDILHVAKDFQDLYAQYKELEETNDLSYIDLSKCMTEMKSKIEKRLEEKLSFLNESLLRPLHTHGSSSSRSTYSTPRHQISSSSRSKDLLKEKESDTSFGPIPKFHEKPIFEQDNDEDMNAYHSLKKQQKESRHTFERNFTLLEHSYDDILQTLLETKLIMLPKSSSYGNRFLDDYCAYHQSNDHATSNCIELKHKVQDLIDNEVVDLRTSSDLCGEDTSLEQDYVDDPMSSSGSITSSTSSNTHASPNTSKLSNMPPSNKEPNAFHVHNVYPQGLPLKETQANLHLDRNLFHATMPKDPITTPSTTPFTLHSPLSLEAAPCQKDFKKGKAINFKKDQDQAPFHLLQNFTPPYPMSFPSPKYDEDTTSIISLELTENYEKSSLSMLSKAACQDQSIPSCSTSPYPLQNCAQASSAPIKIVAPIKATHESIDGFDHVAHSKDVDIPFHYPFASPKSILGPHPSKIKPSNLPSILGPYVPSSPTFSTPISPIIPQDQQRFSSLMNFHSSIHLNQSYQPYSSTNPKSFGSENKHKNPLKNKDHYVPSNRHVNAKKKTTFKRPQRSTYQIAKSKKIWVPKPIVEEFCSKALKEKSKAIWIPKSLLKDLNIENTSKLTFKLPKASTPSSSKIALLPHTSKPQAISSMIPPSFQHPSRCVSMLILPNISATLMKSSKAYTYFLSMLVQFFQDMNSYPPYTPLTIISLPSPYQHL
jgi:hypothetical protein